MRMGTPDQQPIYRTVAGHFEQAIERGALRAGDRMPSVRKVCEQFGVSASTAVRVFRLLETRQLVVARPKSGYFVSRPLPRLPANETVPLARPTGGVTDVWRILREFARLSGDAKITSFAAATPDRRLLPEAKIRSLTATINRRKGFDANYPPFAGSPTLRREIARRLLSNGVRTAPDELIVTCGCTEATAIALRAVARAGDTVAVESPTYFSLLQSIELLGMRVLEIPTHPREGISIEALELATRRPGAVAAVVVTPNHQNPLGSRMSDERKRQLYALACERDLPIVEDDVYGDLQHEGPRPWPLKAWDSEGRVLLCSSFSKTIAAGLRVGYLAAGRWRERAEALRYVSTFGTPMLEQEVVAAFLSDGGYDHHLRRLRAALKANTERMAAALSEAFPAGCRATLPRGGYLLWVELPATVDSRLLFQQAAAHGIAIAPGSVFSLTGRYDNFLRLHCGARWDDKLRDGLFALGRLIAHSA